MKSVNVGEEFGKEEVFFLSSCKSSLKNCEGAWDEFRRGKVKKVIDKVVGPVGYEFGCAEKLSGFRAGDGAVGGSP